MITLLMELSVSLLMLWPSCSEVDPCNKGVPGASETCASGQHINSQLRTEKIMDCA
jgi:hypothetical protein